MPRRRAWALAVVSLVLATAFAPAAAGAAGDEISSATPFSVGQTVAGTIGGGNAHDVWSVVLTEGEEVTITVMPTGTPGGGGAAMLLAPDARDVASAAGYALYRSSVVNRSYIDSYALWSFTPALSGTYYVLISADEGSTGYDLSCVRTANPPVGTPDAGDIPGRTAWSGTHRGVVEARTDRNDVYRVRFHAGQSVTITLRPINDPDGGFAYIYVLDPISSSVGSYSTWRRAVNRDGSQVGDARMWAKRDPEIAQLTFTPLYTSTYCVWVKSGSIAGGVPYELEIAGRADDPGSRTRAYLTAPSAPATAYRFRRFTAAGSLTRHTAGTRAVQLRLYRLVHSRWQLYRTYQATLTNRSATLSTYAYPMSLLYTGRWKLVAYHPADSGHLATLSAARYVTVK